MLHQVAAAGGLDDAHLVAGREGQGVVRAVVAADGAVTAAKMASGVIPEPYTLPAANTTTLGGVKQAAAVTDPEDAAEAAAIVTSFKALTASLRAAGILQS